ncbi:hypothetical protein DFJ74DRAFT_452829 [Hyaloraphidium curvatum]|nr:hypothetical protein DFJ74DRAFT_452829 [Hyaloraphidium curvatum]
MSDLSIARVLDGALWLHPVTDGSNLAGHQAYYDAGTPAHPAFMWRFFINHGVVASAAIGPGGPKQAMRRAIAAVLDFARWRFYHFLGDFSWSNAAAYWGPRVPAVSQLIAGTVANSPTVPAELRNITMSWTAGCYGTTAFLMHVLRALNIPAEVMSQQNMCGHTSIRFPELDAYLSHGDDPYASTWGFGPYVPPAEMLLLDGQTYRTWFKPNQTGFEACRNVGRRPIDMKVSAGFVSATTFGKYCIDVKDGLTNASSVEALQNSTVAGNWLYLAQLHPKVVTKPVYDVAYLKANGLWDRLEAYRIEFGCNAAPTCWKTGCQGYDKPCAYCVD